MQVLASRSVSSRTYHSAVHASTSQGTPHASDILARPRFVAIAIKTARMLRFNSADRARLPPPAWTKQSRNLVRWSSSISSEAIGANGSIPASSSLSSLASAGTSSAVSFGITSLSSSSRRTAPVSPGSAPARVFSSSASAACSSSLPRARASPALAGLPTSLQYASRRGAHCSGVNR
jgi:hypothetical protein